MLTTTQALSGAEEGVTAARGPAYTASTATDKALPSCPTPQAPILRDPSEQSYTPHDVDEPAPAMLMVEDHGPATSRASSIPTSSTRALCKLTRNTVRVTRIKLTHVVTVPESPLPLPTRSSVMPSLGSDDVYASGLRRGKGGILQQVECSSPASSSPVATPSLRERFSNVSIRSAASRAFGLAASPRSDSTATAAPTAHSPLTNFSRPRTETAGFTRNTPLPADTIETAFTADAQHPKKTASRIPLFGSSRTTLVAVKPRSAAAALSGVSDANPSLGRQSMSSVGTKAEQSASQLCAIVGRPSGSISSATSSGRCDNRESENSRLSSPEAMVDRSSEEEEEVITPTLDPKNPYMLLGPGHGVLGSAKRVVSGTEDKAVDNKTYHPASGFTGTLPTIHSQPAFPLNPGSGLLLQSGPSQKKVPSLSKQVPDVQCTLPANPEQTDIARKGASSSTWDSTDLLQEYEQQDQQPAGDASDTVAGETSDPLHTTLSHLEGNSSIYDTKVDNDAVLRMFGHVQQDLEGSRADTRLFENVTKPGEITELDTSNTEPSFHGSSRAGLTQDQLKDAAGLQRASRPPTFTHQHRQVRSQWSHSSPSEKEVSQPSEDISRSSLRLKASFNSSRPGGEPSFSSSAEPPRSIGFPHQVRGKASMLFGTADSDDESMPAPIQRSHHGRLPSSPGTNDLPSLLSTCLVHSPGSPNIGNRANASFTSVPPVDESSHTRFAIPQRQESEVAVRRVHKTQGSEMAANRLQKTPKSGLKNRAVFSKINGLFHGKNEKQSKMVISSPIGIPKHVPRVEPMKSISHPHLVIAPEPPDSTVPRIPDLPAMGTAPAVRTPAPASQATPLALNPHSARYDAPRSMSRATPDDRFTTSVGVSEAVSQALVDHAGRREDAQRKRKLLEIAEALRQSAFNARQAEMFCDHAEAAARSARLEMDSARESVVNIESVLARMLAGLGGDSQ